MAKIAVCRIVVFSSAALAALALCFTRPAHSADDGVIYGVRAVGPQLIVRSLSLVTLTVQERGRLPNRAQERLADVVEDNARGVAVLRTSIAAGVSRRGLVRAAGTPEVVTDASNWEVGGLSSSFSISSVVVPMTGSAIAFVSHYSDTQPFFLATLDYQQGRTTVVTAVALNAQARFGNLTQCPDGKIYATSLAQQWDPHIAQVDIVKQTVTLLREFTVKGKSLHRDVADLACSPSNRLYALADPDHSGINDLFAVDLATGTMTLVREFDVDRMIFVR